MDYRRNLQIGAQFIYGLVFHTNSRQGWTKVGEDQVAYDLDKGWDDNISIEREAYAWTQLQILGEGKELSKLPKPNQK